MNLVAWITPTAKKDHTCDYCGLTIPKGEKYIRQTNNSDGLYTWKCHTDCQDIIDELGLCDFTGDGFTGDDFKQCIEDEYKVIWHIPDSLPVTFEDKLKVVKQKYLKP